MVDIHNIAPNDARILLKDYIECIWSENLCQKSGMFTHYDAGLEFSHRHSMAMEPATVPWDSLNSVSLREKLLVCPGRLIHVPTLNPVQMAVSDVYEVLSLLLKEQDSGGIQPLMFTTSSQVTSGSMELDDRISELSDLPTFVREKMTYTYPL